MREPQRAWRLAQARAVLDARQAVQAVFRVLEEEKQKGEEDDEHEEEKEDD